MAENRVKFISRYNDYSKVESIVLVNDVQIKKKVLDNESPLTLCMAEQLAKALRVPLESVRFGVHSVTPYVPEQRKSLHEHFGSGNIVKDRWIPPN